MWLKGRLEVVLRGVKGQPVSRFLDFQGFPAWHKPKVIPTLQWGPLAQKNWGGWNRPCSVINRFISCHSLARYHRAEPEDILVHDWLWLQLKLKPWHSELSGIQSPALAGLWSKKKVTAPVGRSSCRMWLLAPCMGLHGTKERIWGALVCKGRAVQFLFSLVRNVILYISFTISS